MNTIIYLILAFLLITGIVLPWFRSAERTEISPGIRDNSSGKFAHLSLGYTHYDIAGPEDGTVIVFIHGFSVPYYMWDRNFKALAAAGFRVIRFDLYGRGLSDRPKAIYHRRFFVDQLSELLDALRINKPVHLVGNSMGGAIAAAFAAEFPERAGKVVLIAPFFEIWRTGLFKIPVIGEYLAACFLVPALPRRQLQDFVHPEDFPEWPELFQEQMRYKGFGRALLSTLRNFLSKDPTPDYEKIAQDGKSTLLIWGGQDRTLGTQGAGEMLKILYHDFLWIGPAGHVPQYEYLELVNSRLMNFLADESGLELLRKQA